MLNDVGDLAEHVLVASGGERKEPEALRRAGARESRPEGDECVVEPFLGVGDEEAGIELENSGLFFASLVIRLEIELGKEAGGDARRSDYVLVGEQQSRSDQEARALRATVAENDPSYRIGGGATAGQKRHADKVVRETDDRFRACLRLRRRLGHCRLLDCFRRLPDLAGELFRIEFLAQGRLIELCAKTGDSAVLLRFGPKRISVTDLLETSCDLVSRGNKPVGDHVVESTLRNI